MSHFGDYMDGVPVKISEKYRRPPTIELPYSVIECPQRAQQVVDSVDYSTKFEENVLAKVKELRSAKETKRNERRHRLQLLEEAKQRKLDEIAAAEAQEKLKQLSVSEVSYPSTEEISVLSTGENTNCDTAQVHNTAYENTETPNNCYPSCSSAEPEHNILQPIQLPANYPQKSLLDDPDPLQELKNNTKYTKVPMYNNIDSLTFKDFEHDTSSPFDNVELKTINDREQLAQVLQSHGAPELPLSHASSMSCSQPQAYMTPDQMYVTSSCASQPQIPTMSYMPNYMEQSMQTPSVMYTQQPYPITNGYYTPAENICDSTLPVSNVNMYMPNYQYYVPPTPYVVDPNYYSNLPSGTDSLQNGANYIPQTYYYQFPHIPMQFSAESYSVPQQTVPLVDSGLEQQSTHTIKSRSRSVADIVKELNAEVMSAKEREHERSATASPALKPALAKKSTTTNKREEKRKKKVENLPNPFDKLNPKQQDMCKKIQGMGFPLDRVARVCQLVGDNDKKIVECLLILNELMDLGFSEARVAAALAKNEFNRDKALDELVS